MDQELVGPWQSFHIEEQAAAPVANKNMESTRDDISFFTRGLYTDVEFLVGNYSHLPRRIRAHKLLLAMRNEVFEVMFYGDLPEENEIRIPDLHPDGFVGLLR